jgi:hypothetical protein
MKEGKHPPVGCRGPTVTGYAEFRLLTDGDAGYNSEVPAL